MVNKDIKKMSRAELVEIIYQMKKSEQELQEQVLALKKRLEDRSIKVEQVGSVAEAALSLSDVFAAAQTAADTYLEEIRCRRADAEKECDQIISEAQKRADAIVQDAVRRKDVIEQQCNVSRAELRRVKEVLQSLSDELALDQ